MICLYGEYGARGIWTSEYQNTTRGNMLPIRLTWGLYSLYGIIGERTKDLQMGYTQTHKLLQQIESLKTSAYNGEIPTWYAYMEIERLQNIISERELKG